MQALQVVLPGVDDLDGFDLLRPFPAAVQQKRLQWLAFGRQQGFIHRQRIVAQGLGGVAAGVLTHLFGRALANQQAAVKAAFGAEVEQPVGSANHVQVVLDE